MKNPTHAQEIQIRIVCQHLPGSRFGDRTGVRLGIQKGTEVIDDVGAGAGSVTFSALFRVVQDPETGAPNFLGPYAQGTPQERFVYLCWGERTGGGWDGFRRAKLPLRPVSAELLDRAEPEGRVITAVVGMTDRKGEPLCATIKPDAVVWRLEPEPSREA